MTPGEVDHQLKEADDKMSKFFILADSRDSRKKPLYRVMQAEGTWWGKVASYRTKSRARLCIQRLMDGRQQPLRFRSW